MIKGLPQPEKAQSIDLGPVNARLAALEKTLADWPRPKAAAPVRLDPLNTRIDNVERALRGLPKPEKVNLAPFDARLVTIEEQLRALGRRLAKPAPKPKPVAKKRVQKKKTGPVLLKKASYGKKDDLKRISGVGPKLERLLNKHGVYYFWQVASWTRKDVKIVDDRLEVFKGRIDRDNWVSQAKVLRKEPTAAKAPR
jgi:predicted flap endonuclease-1-like 5' DNA nuclease